MAAEEPVLLCAGPLSPECRPRRAPGVQEQGDEEGLPEGLRKLQVTRSSSPQRTGDESPRSVAALSRYSSHDSSLPEQSAQLAGPAMAAAGASTPLQQASLRVRSDGGWEAPLLPPVRVAAAPAGSARRSALAAELARGNAFISTIPLPGNVSFTPVHDSCCLVLLASEYDIPPIAVALGASYFQRLLAKHAAMQSRAVGHGFYISAPPPPLPARQGLLPGQATLMMRAQRSLPPLISIYATCICLAAKMLGSVQHSGLMSSMLSAVLGDEVPSEETECLEAAVLHKLDWRLGPFFDLGGEQPGCERM